MKVEKGKAANCISQYNRLEERELLNVINKRWIK
jgi:hypothetical protein